MLILAPTYSSQIITFFLILILISVILFNKLNPIMKKPEKNDIFQVSKSDKPLTF